jgi:hypothetical protein
VHTGFWWGNLRKKPFGCCRNRREDNIEIGVKEIVWGRGLG